MSSVDEGVFERSADVLRRQTGYGRHHMTGKLAHAQRASVLTPPPVMFRPERTHSLHLKGTCSWILLAHTGFNPTNGLNEQIDSHHLTENSEKTSSLCKLQQDSNYTNCPECKESMSVRDASVGTSSL